MAPRKMTAEMGRATSRKSLDGAADQAGLVALTTTLLAGAVTGAVAGVLEARDDGSNVLPHPGAGPARGEEAAASPDPAQAVPQDRPQPSAKAEQAHDAPVDAATTDRSAAIDTDTVSPATAYGAEHAASDDIALPLARTPLHSAEVAPADPAAPTPEPAANDIDHALARAESSGTSARSSENLVATPQGSIADRIDSVSDKVEAALDAGSAALTAHAMDTVAQITATLEDTLSQVSNSVHELTESLPALAARPIPAVLLGADPEDRQPDGLLAGLFDSAEDGVSPIALPQAPLLGTIAGGASEPAHQSAQDAPPAGLADFAMPDVFGAIDAVRVGFAGQSYSELADAHDGHSGTHGNLLSGLL